MCDSGKNRFKAQGAAGSAYSGLAKAKKEAKARCPSLMPPSLAILLLTVSTNAHQAAKAASGKGERPRDKLRAEASERARKFDEERGRGGDTGKKKGWFG